MGKGDHYRNEKVQEAVVSHIKGNGDVLLSGRDITAEGANLESAAHLKAVAENDIVLNGAKESRHFEAFHKTKSGSVAKVTKTRFDQPQSETRVGTQVSGNQVLLAAGNDAKAKGVQAIAENDLQVQAGHDVDIAADTNHFKNIHKETKKTSGVFTSGAG
ncbi:hemagglutinin repeat-containing protein [Avibacterium paragallinarum]|uniref:hemagglutinin repeat-containing protein n=1 Tax=Avibacterium paragallinarum TaxID=728 RepID=UPI003AF0E976